MSEHRPPVRRPEHEMPPHAGNPTKAATTPFDVGAPAPGAKDRARHYPRRSNATNVAAPFNVGAPSRCERPGHDMTLVGATPNEAAPRSMYEHRPGAKDRTTLPPNGQPYQRGSPPFDVGAPAPGAKGSGTKSPRRRPISLPD